MPSANILTPLLPDRFYHIYNRGNDGTKIFQEDENYRFFLTRYHKYLGDYTDTFAFCLLPNHFHFLIRTSSKSLPSDDRIFSNQFRRLFISYTLAYNKRNLRTGNLFDRYFKRVEVTSQNYLKGLIFYIHHNPQKHGITDNFRRYRYSSYQSFFITKTSNIKREEVIRWFNNDLEEFREYHEALHNEWSLKNYTLEE